MPRPILEAVEVPPEEMESEQALLARFDDDRIAGLCEEFLEEGIGFNANERRGGRPFVVAYIPSDSPYADIPLATETKVFGQYMRQTLTQVRRDYGPYDGPSQFVAVIDTTPERPVAAGMLRIVEHDPEVGFKDKIDLVKDDRSNPWRKEIKVKLFEPGEEYTPEEAWRRLAQSKGVELPDEKSVDIATHAVLDAYATGAAADGVSMLFFHACLREALAHGHENLLAIFDQAPWHNLQTKLGYPFDSYDLVPQKYGGPNPTFPAFCKIERALGRMTAFNDFVGAIMIQGFTLDGNALLPNEYDPEHYSNEAVGVPANS